MLDAVNEKPFLCSNFSCSVCPRKTKTELGLICERGGNTV